MNKRSKEKNNFKIYWPSYIVSVGICMSAMVNEECSKTNHIYKNCLKGEIESIIQKAIFWQEEVPMDIRHKVEAINQMNDTGAFYGEILEPTDNGYISYGTGMLIYQGTDDDSTLVTAIVVEPNENSYQGQKFYYEFPGRYTYNMNDERLRQDTLKLTKN